MKALILLPGLTSVLLLTACSSEPDKSLLYPKRMMDSVFTEAYYNTMLNEKDTLPDSITNRQAAVNAELADLQKRLSKAESELSTINGTKSGLSESEKNQAAIDKIVEIENLKGQMDLLERMNNK
ncbi:MAG: hypothetical protein QM534_17825 [Sediminibacterium sp.]|nr:hypothetical protein [Sediminibacterium sp.]